MAVDFESLVGAAAKLVGEFRTPGCVTGAEVACAIQSVSGDVFTGVSIEAACGVGFCAEHSAVATMLKARQTQIVACVAVGKDGVPLPPCGRCRELMYQVSPENLGAQILVANAEIRTLRELLPSVWTYR